MPAEFTVVIERDAEGWLVASVPSLAGCHTQARTMDKLLERIGEAIRLCLEVRSADTAEPPRRRRGRSGPRPGFEL